jgi:hypothetical protein
MLPKVSTVSMRCFLVAAVVLSVSGATKAGISYPDFTVCTGLNLQEAAAPFGSLLRLTPASSGQRGSAWYTTQQSVDQGFSTTFQFRISELGGTNDDDGNTGADGLAFVIQNESPTALGDVGIGIGYAGILDSLAIEFDTFNNGISNGDPSGNHISVQTNGLNSNSHDHHYSLGSTSAIPNLSDGAAHTASVLYQPGAMAISVDGAPALNVPLDLSNTLALSGGKAWVGFTAATASAWENHDLQSWSMVSLPEPSTVALLGVGAIITLLAYAWRQRRAA